MIPSNDASQMQHLNCFDNPPSAAGTGLGPGLGQSLGFSAPLALDVGETADFVGRTAAAAAEGVKRGAVRPFACFLANLAASAFFSPSTCIL